MASLKAAGQSALCLSTFFAGEVKGVEMEEQLEDQLRQDIDTTIKRITPNIFPAMYKVHFVPATDSRSQDLGKEFMQIISLSGTLLYRHSPTPVGLWVQEVYCILYLRHVVKTYLGQVTPGGFKGTIPSISSSCLLVGFP